MKTEYVPLNDYVLIQVQSEPETDLVDPDKDDDNLQVGTIIDPGKHGQQDRHDPQSPQDYVEVGDEVEWVRFSGSGRTKELSDGSLIAQIPFDRLTMKRKREAKS